MTKRVKAFKKASADYQIAKETIDQLRKEIREIGAIDLNSKLSVNVDSSDSQFMFGLGVINSRIEAAAELGLPEEDLVKDKENLLTLHKLCKELREWKSYAHELFEYKEAVEQSLTKLDKFLLLEKPVSPAEK